MEEHSKERVLSLAVEGLLADGEKHKQWYLEQIILQLGYSLEYARKVAAEEGLPDWEKGTPP